jgi:hypothetical protein
VCEGVLRANDVGYILQVSADYCLFEERSLLPEAVGVKHALFCGLFRGCGRGKLKRSFVLEGNGLVIFVVVVCESVMRVNLR